MNTTFQTTAIIRQRGQLTIPDKLRELFSWIKENAVIVLEAAPNNAIIVKPYDSNHDNMTLRWQKAYDAIHLTRSFEGKRGNLSQFVTKDREKH